MSEINNQKNTLLGYFPSIDLILGPMFSSKSTELVKRAVLYQEIGLKTIVVNSLCDTRSETYLSTHNPTTKESGIHNFLKVQTLSEILPDLTMFDVIAIDESNLFPDLVEVVLKLVETHKKKVIVSGLSGSYKREHFGQTHLLIPHCDTIMKLSSYCLLCKMKGILRDAHFSSLKYSDQRSEIVVGGKEKYIPTCRECYF